MPTDAQLSQYLQQEFQKVYGDAPDLGVMAPGRANLIGEHIDYNDGYVMPFAIDRQIGMAVKKRKDRTVRLYSQAFDAWSEFSIDAIGKDASQPWSNFERGVADVLQKTGHALSGADIWFYGDIPLGAGLSSSAAVEVATALAFNELCQLGIQKRELALLAQKAENQFVGVNCGIMDQFASALSPANGILHLDCQSLEYRAVPFDAPDIAIVLANTNVQRSLTASAYNERRSQCDEGIRLLKQRDPSVTSFRDVTPEILDRHAGALTAVVLKRCRHVISEIQRVSDCCEALTAGDFNTVGRLVDACHFSLRDLYEVSSAELDAMVDIAHRVDGVYGARMVGAGFGGCALILVNTAAVDALSQQIRTQYPAATALQPEVYACRISPGARRLF